MSPKIHFLLVTFSIATVYAISPSNFGLEKDEMEDFLFFNSFFANYKTYELIIHVDNYTQTMVEGFLRMFESPAMIYNHDLFNIASMKRPRGLGCLNVVMLHNPMNFKAYSEQKGNLEFNDTVVFLTLTATLRTLHINEKNTLGLAKAGKILIINAENNYDIYTVCFYCGKMNGRMSFWQKVPFGQPFPFHRSLREEPFQDFQGHLMKVAFINYFPFIYCTRKDKVFPFCKDGIGSELKLLSTLSNTLNFDFELIEMTNYSYDDLINGLTHGRYDFAIGGLSLTPERREILEFTNIIRFEDIALMFVYQEPFFYKLKKIGNSTFQIRYVLIITCVLSVFFIYVVLKYFNNITHLSILKLYMFITATSTDQPILLKTLSKIRTQTTVFVILASWFLFAMLVNMILRSKLSAMMVSSPLKHFTLQELFDQGYNLAVDAHVANSYLYLFNDRERNLIAKKGTVQKQNICELLRYVETHKAVMVGEISRNLLHPKIDCTQTDRRRRREMSSRMTKEVFWVTPHAWLFRAGAPFVDVFNRQITQVMSGGLLRVWTQDILYQKKLYTYLRKMRDNENPSITLDHFLVAMAYLLISLCTGILCFIAEIVYYYYWQKRGRKV